VSEAGVLISAELAADIQDLVAEWRSGAFRPTPQRPYRDAGQRPPLVGILLADLPSGGKVDCAALIEFSAGQVQNQIQKVEQLGSVTGGTFTIGWAPPGQSIQKTPALAWNISAADLQTALNKLSTIGTKGVTVTLGSQKYTHSFSQVQTAENPGLWLVSFTGKQFDKTTTFPLLTVTSSLTGVQGPTLSISELTYWGDSGRVETVKAAIPVGTPTPLRAGATCLAHFVPGSGYILGSVEPRQFGPPY